MDPNDDILAFIPDRVGYMTAPNCKLIETIVIDERKEQWISSNIQ